MTETLGSQGLQPSHSATLTGSKGSKRWVLKGSLPQKGLGAEERCQGSSRPKSRYKKLMTS